MDNAGYVSVHWIVTFGVLLLVWGPILWAAALILKKAGHNPWWSILAIVPIANWVALMIFATSNWPALRGPTDRPS